ncbi:MAG: SnoaL-like domain protein [Pseudonocardiales bacterium]|nr:SnoaL-like domain protein [Pseudonocardiales bacterium]
MSDWIDDYFTAWNGTDSDAVVSYFTEDVEIEDVTAGHLSHGRDAAKKFFEVCLERVPGAQYEVVEKRTLGDAYWVEWIMHVNDVHVRGASVGTLRDGKIAVNHDYWNGALFKV